MSATAEGATGSFALGDDHRLIVEQVARLAERELFPLQGRMDAGTTEIRRLIVARELLDGA